MKKKIAFFDTKPYDKASFDEANKKFNFNITYFEGKLSAKTAKLLQEFEAVCVFVNDVIDKKVIEILKKNDIKILALRCAGYNNVDLEAIHGFIHVVRVPAYSPYAVAEHTVSLMMTLNRKIHKSYSRTREGNFSLNGLEGFDMHGRTAGIIGTGKIGQCLISILKGFGMEVLAYDLFPNEKYAKEAGIKYVSLDEIYEKSNIISLHCPLTEETKHMINNESITKMKKGVMIINTGRGKLINSKDLIKGLKSGKIGSAGLDVYEEESAYFFEDKSTDMITDDVLARLMTFPNVIITSHQAFLTEDALNNIAKTTLQNVADYFNDAPLKNEICYFCETGKTEDCPKKCF